MLTVDELIADGILSHAKFFLPLKGVLFVVLFGRFRKGDGHDNDRDQKQTQPVGEGREAKIHNIVGKGAVKQQG
jgi:hypothetical protein